MDKHTDKNQPKKQDKAQGTSLADRADRNEAQLKEFGAKLDKISSKADQAGANTKADHKKRIDLGELVGFITYEVIAEHIIKEDLKFALKDRPSATAA